MYILGLDTSAYRTSVCLMDQEGRVVIDERRLLEVKPGGRGLQQSAAVFQHVKHLPDLLQGKEWPRDQLRAVAVSASPRPVKDSYMPVFHVGLSFARWLAHTLGVPCYLTTHQEGHVAAGLWALGEVGHRLERRDAFLAVHVSGGTTELLLVRPWSGGYQITSIGGTLDLYAGQLIDRIGVALGLPFPSGPALEALAAQAEEESRLRIPSAVKGTAFSFSGPEAQALRCVAAGEAPPAIARAVEVCVANTLEKALRNAFAAGYPRTVLWVGGGMANRFIRRRLQERLEHPAVGAVCHFCPPAYSGDNACGVAWLGWKQWNSERVHGKVHGKKGE